MRAVALAGGILLLAAAGPACGFDWPVEEPLLLATFGASHGGGFRGGIDLRGGGEEVYPIADGEVIFSHVEGEPSSLPRGNGSFVALQHEGGIQSIYSHLRGVVRTQSSVRARDRRPIGMIGDTGAVPGPRLSLMIVDAQEHRLLNPIKLDKPPLSPPLKGDDAVPPVVEQVLLARDGEALAILDGMTVAPGAGEILVVAYDTVSHGSFSSRTAPFRFSVSSSGQVLREITLDALEEADGRLVVAKHGLRYEDLYAGRWTYRLGRITLPEGQTHIQIRVDGFTGAATTVDLFLHAGPQSEDSE